MAYKLGFLLSLFFVVQVLAYVGDLSAIQAVSALLDATAITAGNRIAIEGGIQQDVRDFVYENAKATIEALPNQTPQVGGIYIFKIFREYRPLVLSESPFNVSVTRSTVIGYLD